MRRLVNAEAKEYRHEVFKVRMTGLKWKLWRFWYRTFVQYKREIVIVVPIILASIVASHYLIKGMLWLNQFL